MSQGSTNAKEAEVVVRVKRPGARRGTTMVVLTDDRGATQQYKVIARIEAEKRWEWWKPGAAKPYEVRMSQAKEISCTCEGWKEHGKCKHTAYSIASGWACDAHPSRREMKAMLAQAAEARRERDRTEQALTTARDELIQSRKETEFNRAQVVEAMRMIEERDATIAKLQADLDHAILEVVALKHDAEEGPGAYQASPYDTPHEWVPQPGDEVLYEGGGAIVRSCDGKRVTIREHGSTRTRRVSVAKVTYVHQRPREQRPREQTPVELVREEAPF